MDKSYTSIIENELLEKEKVACEEAKKCL